MCIRDRLNLEEEFIQAKQTISKKPNITIIPQDTKLKSLFVEAKKQAFSNNPQRAMPVSYTHLDVYKRQL